jgi:hypothetical protein
VESVDEIYLIEYKNANIEEAEFPESFEPFSQTKINNIAKKYFDSLVYVKALCEKEICNYKPCVFIYILEYPNGDDSSRRELRNILRFGNDSRKGKRKYYLPFVIQKRGGLGNKLIERVEVLSINEWTIKYPHYPITEITKEG